MTPVTPTLVGRTEGVANGQFMGRKLALRNKMGRGQLEGSDYYVRGGGRIEDPSPTPFCSAPKGEHRMIDGEWGALIKFRAPHHNPPL